MIRDELKSGRTLFGLCAMYACPGIVEAIGKGFDFAWIDAQHGLWDWQDLANEIRVCELVGVHAIPRVADHNAGNIGRVLDLNAAGVIVPFVNNAAEARAIADAACFPPLGRRSYGARRAIDRRGRAYATDPAQRPLLIVQIETREGAENADEIAAVEGIDVLFFGPDDMKLSLGLPLDLPIHAEETAPAARKVVAACRATGKHAMSVSGSQETLEKMLALGFSMMVAGSDVGFLRKGAAETLKGLETLRGKERK